MDATVTMRFVNGLILPWLTIFFHTITNLSVDPRFFFFSLMGYLYFFSLLLQQSYSSLRTTSYLRGLEVLFPYRIIFYIAIEYY